MISRHCQCCGAEMLREHDRYFTHIDVCGRYACMQYGLDHQRPRRAWYWLPAVVWAFRARLRDRMTLP